MRIEVVDTAISFRSVLAVSESSGSIAVGNFYCSDERLNRIYQTAVRTVSLCMQEYLWDGIKRDRLVRVGDMHPKVSVITAMFGTADFTAAAVIIGKKQEAESK